MSYGAGSYLSASADEPSGSFGAYAIYAPENLDKLLAGFREELDKVLKDGFTEQEIAEAKSGILQSNQLRRAQDGALSGTLAAYQRIGRDMTFVAGFESADATTSAGYHAQIHRPGQADAGLCR